MGWYNLGGLTVHCFIHIPFALNTEPCYQLSPMLKKKNSKNIQNIYILSLLKIRTVIAWSQCSLWHIGKKCILCDEGEVGRLIGYKSMQIAGKKCAPTVNANLTSWYLRTTLSHSDGVGWAILCKICLRITKSVILFHRVFLKKLYVVDTYISDIK